MLTLLLSVFDHESLSCAQAFVVLTLGPQALRALHRIYDEFEGFWNPEIFPLDM